MNILWYQKCWNYPSWSKIDTYFHSVITCVHFTFRNCWFWSICTKKRLISNHCTLLKSVTDSLTKLNVNHFCWESSQNTDYIYLIIWEWRLDSVSVSPGKINFRLIRLQAQGDEGSLCVQEVQGGGVVADSDLGAVHIKPGVAHKLLLVEDGPVGAEERELFECSCRLSDTHVVHLTESLLIRIKSSAKVQARVQVPVQIPSPKSKKGKWNLDSGLLNY